MAGLRILPQKRYALASEQMRGREPGHSKFLGAVRNDCVDWPVAARPFGAANSQLGLMIVNIVENLQPFETDDSDPRDEIVRLESRLEELAEALARCRKIKLISQIAVAGGGIWLLAVTTGVIGLDPVALMAAISGVIGGTVMYGSNITTSREIDFAMNEAEAQRAALIGTLDLRVVGELE